MENKPLAVDLEEWESLLRHPHFSKVTILIQNRIDSLQNGIKNRAKQSMTLDTAIESSGDLRSVAELDRLLQIIESLKHQVVNHKGASNVRPNSESV